MHPLIRIGIEIRRKRLSIGLSQEELAAMAQIDRTYMQNIEAGKRSLSVIVLKKILDALQISLSDFFKEIEL